MAVNFPNNPALNETFVSGSVVYEWNGTAWIKVNRTFAYTQDAAPTSPRTGDLWFDTNNLELFVWYDDGSSAQWVSIEAVGSGSWDNDGTYLTYTGALNVGIGVAMPTSRFQVNGGILADDVTATANMSTDLINVGTTPAPAGGSPAVMQISNANTNDRFYMAPTDQAGSFDYSKEFGFDPSTGDWYFEAPVVVREGTVNTSVTQGTIKTWIQYNQAGPTINSDLNVTSVTDTAAGNFTVNFTNNFAAATYSTTTTVTDGGLNTTVGQCSPSGLAKTTASEQYFTATTAAGGNDNDNGIHITGALA